MTNSYTLRNYEKTDALQVVAMLNADRTTPRALVDGAGNIRLIRYVPFSCSKVVVEDSHGQIVGYAYVADKENNFVFETGSGIHPEHQNSEVGSRLLQWAQAESLRLSQGAPQGVRCVLQVNIFEAEQETVALYEAAGYVKVRTWAHYEIKFNIAPPHPKPTEGMRIRLFDLDNDADWDTVGPVQDAAFMDHWGAYTLPPVEQVEPEAEARHGEGDGRINRSHSTRAVRCKSGCRLCPHWRNSGCLCRRGCAGKPGCAANA
jgi:L-amino acid N-acyltransferase YncA